MKVKSAVPLILRLNMNRPINAWDMKAVRDPINKTSFPKYFLLFFSLLSLYSFNIFSPTTIVKRVKPIMTINPRYPKSKVYPNIPGSI